MNNTATELLAPSHTLSKGEKVSRLAIGAAVISILGACLLGQSVPFDISGVHASVLEAAALVIFLGVCFSSNARKSPLWRPYLFLIAMTVIPAFRGIEGNDLSRVLRDYSQVIYISFLFVGFYLYSNKFISVKKVIIATWFTSVLYSIVFLLNMFIFHNEFIELLQYEMRVISAFAIISLLASLLGILKTIKINLVVGIMASAVLVAFTMQVRTRALFVMIALGIIILVVVALLGGKHRINQKRGAAFLAAIAILLIILAPMSEGLAAFTQSFWERIATMSTDSYSQDITIAYRLSAWSMAEEGFRAYPWFGVGFGSYLFLDPWLNGAYDWYPPAMIHNAFWQILYTGGITYLIGYVYLFYKVLSLRSADDGSDWADKVLLKSFVIAFLVYSAFGVTFFKVTEALFFWFLVGVFAFVSNTQGAPAKKVSA